jgi:hypothetical protein
MSARTARTYDGALGVRAYRCRVREEFQRRRFDAGFARRFGSFALFDRFDVAAGFFEAVEGLRAPRRVFSFIV